MTVKPVPKHPGSQESPRPGESAQSGVQLSRVALFEQRMTEIYDDVQSGRCSTEEAIDRVVEAVLARSSGRFTARGQAGLEAHVREACKSDPRLRSALQGK